MRAVLVLALAVAAPAVADDRRTGYDDMTPELQAMQDDLTANPGIFTVMAGEALFSTPAGPGGACADCHSVAGMAGVAARYPAWDEEGGRAVDLPGRIALCRTRHQGAEPFAPEDPDLVALLAFVTHQSRGMPIAPDPDPRMEPVRAEGRALFGERMGQLNLSCAQCHDDHAGGRLAAALIPQAHPTGYPQYRLEWEETGTLERRLGGCLFGVRAERYPPGAPEIVALTAYLMERAAGLAVESPAVRP